MQNPEILAEVEKKVRDNFNKAFENALVEGGEIEEDDDDFSEDDE